MPETLSLSYRADLIAPYMDLDQNGKIMAECASLRRHRPLAARRQVGSGGGFPPQPRLLGPPLLDRPSVADVARPVLFCRRLDRRGGWPPVRSVSSRVTLAGRAGSRSAGGKEAPMTRTARDSKVV